ncbi:MAG: hypothetical protein ACFFC7_12435 [Candidatus Hermodarchaeota archaeon]
MEKEGVETQKKEIDVVDETLEILRTIGALVRVLPAELSTELSMQIICSLFMTQKNFTMLAKAPEKALKIVHQYCIENKE